MKIICHREAFLSACQLASTAVPSKDVKPVLRNIKAEATPDRCTLMATDLELGLKMDVGSVEVKKPGTALLPAQKIIAILREARDDQLEIQADADAITIKGKNLEFDLPVEDPALFPDVPDFDEEKCHEIRAGDLREMIKRTVFACATETARYSMTGVLWELDGTDARLVATDGRRLAMTQGLAKPVGGHATTGMSTVVPAKAMGVLERNLADDDEIVKVHIQANDLFFKTDCSTIYSRLIEGRFPDYKAILPKSAALKLLLSAGAFMAGVRQAAIMTDDETKKLNFHLDPGKIVLQAQAALGGKSKVEMAVDYDGPSISTSFNPAFLIDMLKTMPAETELQLELNDPARPVLFRAGSSYIYLVMPLT
jgi:DNA polymerase-3 subunit beta